MHIVPHWRLNHFDLRIGCWSWWRVPPTITLDYGQIPNTLGSHGPMDMYHVPAMWAFWATRCKHPYDPTPITDWRIATLTKFKEHFCKRIAGALSMAQWVKLAQSRRNESGDGLGNPIRSAAGKDFLLIHTQSIRANAAHLACGGEGPNPNIMKWVGEGNLATIGNDVCLNGNKPRYILKLNHARWGDSVHPEDLFAPSPAS